jgi:tetratricopeptide (TPR) repeat protein
MKPSLLLLALLIAACSDQKTTTNEQASAQQMLATTSLPGLFERTGELANATEWPRVKAKVNDLKIRINNDPKDLKARLQLVTIYLSEARITGEHPYYYPALLTMLDSILAIDPNSFEATTFKASVLMSQHQFAAARELAEKARAINPNNAYIYGVLIDANVELGNYEEAVKLSDKMQELKPSLESYARVSYLREIYGDYPGAIAAMKLAVEAGVPGSEPYCWTKHILGQLYETTGNLAEAEKQYAGIVYTRPSYAPAIAGQARVLAAKKQYPQALTLLDKAAAIMPEFSFHEEMGKVYAAQGNVPKAAAKYAEVAKMLAEDAESGHTVDLELCKLYTLSGQYDLALKYGQKEYAKRPQNIDVNHALAEVYAAKNDWSTAKKHLQAALRTGHKNPEWLELAVKGERVAKQ